MEKILILYLFLVVGFLFCIVYDFIGKKCKNDFSLISIFSIFYLVFSIPFYCYYNNYYDSIYLFVNILSLGFFIYSLVLQDCKEPTVVFYGIIMTVVIFSICIFLIKNIYKKNKLYTPPELEEFDIIV
jgi:hypothetical protein